MLLREMSGWDLTTKRALRPRYYMLSRNSSMKGKVILQLTRAVQYINQFILLFMLIFSEGSLHERQQVWRSFCLGSGP